MVEIMTIEYSLAKTSLLVCSSVEESCFNVLGDPLAEDAIEKCFKNGLVNFTI